MAATSRNRLVRSTRVAIALFAASAVLGACAVIPFPDRAASSVAPPACRASPAPARRARSRRRRPDRRCRRPRGAAARRERERARRLLAVRPVPDDVPAHRGRRATHRRRRVERRAAPRVVVTHRTRARPLRRRLPRTRCARRCGSSRATASARSSTSTRTRGARRSRRGPAKPVPRGRNPRSDGTARPAGPRSTAARRGARSPESASSVRRCGPRSPRSGPIEPGPGGVGVRTRYAAMVGHVAGRFAHEPAVAGYDVMNEPNAFGATELQGLSDLYAATVACDQSRREAAAGGFAHLVFFEPSILWSDTDLGVPPPFPHDGGVVFAPHIYRGGLTSGPVQRSDFERARRDAATFGGAPVFVGEWGSGPERAEDPTDVYFRTHQQLQDEFHFSATLWTWRESCGDPHKAGDARAGRVPSVWGEFEVDCRTNTVVGPRDALLEQLTRAYVRAAPGRLVVSAYEPGSGRFIALGARRTRARADGGVVPDAARPARDDHVRRPARRSRPDHATRRRLHLRHDDRRRVAPRPVALTRRQQTMRDLGTGQARDAVPFASASASARARVAASPASAASFS